MFRLAKVPETGDPAFFLLCDHRQCMDARRGPANLANQEEFLLSKKTFVTQAVEEGWLIDLEGTFCPFHAREIRHVAQQTMERRSQIVPAQPGHVAAFGRSL